MATIEWGEWTAGSLDPKIIIDPNSNFETRRQFGVWEYRTGTVRQPKIDQVYLYGQHNDEWVFGEAQNPATHFIVIETADGLPTGKIQIGTV